ncbi:DUF3379 domain-containing protein [Vibrio marisflavi]|uniref:Chemotaxis protein n=1 Tax=Vibrio marisflavi CECT 7928 TaxID=634439 RepID=A0ABM9A7R4_9VIBR|nr:DUF3379 domain-containing protein [Vibrio marisflavi]CAH0540749.1 hypothetical protein VMF7928_03090 [Vibrio marisflavi CECT 7928]
MDDLEFRRQIMSDPKYRDNEILEAIQRSDANNKFVDDILELDDIVAKAMNVDVPDDLADRILFNQSSSENSNVIKASFTKRSMAMAASIAFVIGIVVGQIKWGNIIVSPVHASLETTAMKHVIDEKPFVEHLDEQVTSKQINTKLRPFAYQFDQAFPYHVFYLNHCGFGQSNALHMVFQGEKGKVTLFVTNIPSQKSIDFNKDGMSGAIEPVGSSSLILVGVQGENVDQMAKKLSAMLLPAS